jgi:hypothetical protein
MHQQLIDLIYYEYLFDCERKNPEYIKKRYSHLYPRIDCFGGKWWYNKLGQVHREGEPAIIYANGDKFWYWNGRLHREGEPAVIYADGDKFWYVNGQLQRNS